jgi:hypothetical protein
MKIIKSFSDYLKKIGWQDIGHGSYEKDQKTIKFIGGNKILVNNINPRVKHKHIATCLCPITEDEVEVLFKLLMIND